MRENAPFTRLRVWRRFTIRPVVIEELSQCSIAYLIPSVEAAFCITAKHYYAKAGLENQIKLKQKYGDDATAAIDATEHNEECEG